MSTLTFLEKTKLEALFGMGSGYVLKQFTNSSFEEFFRTTARVEVFSPKYAEARKSPSKANCLRAFWDKEPDALVGKVLKELLALWLHENGNKLTSEYEAGVAIVRRLLGVQDASTSESDFLTRRINWPSLERLPVEPTLVPILQARLREAETAHQQKLGLTTVILCGSILEGALLGLAMENTAAFNQSKAAPKDKDGRVRKLQDWTLANFIDAAYELEFLSLDVQKHSHALRDFRNYIHPFAQMASRFTPDEHTANISIQVLKAAFASLAGGRKNRT